MSDLVVIIDFETTGLSPTWGARATEVAAVMLRDGVVVDRFESLMNAGVRVPPEIEAFTGITNDMVRRAPKAEKVMRELHKFIGKSSLVAHNAAFDRKFLQAEFEHIGKVHSTEMLCSMRVARRVYPDAPNHQLATLVRYAGVSSRGKHHRAMADAEMASGLWLKMQFSLQTSFGLPHVPLALFREIQSAPRYGLARCIDRNRNFCAE